MPSLAKLVTVSLADYLHGRMARLELG